MTANKMRNLFKELYDGVAAIEMGYDDVEVSRFLNLAQDIIIRDKFFTTHNPAFEGFETSSHRDIELSNLKREITIWKDNETNIWYLRMYDNNFNDINEEVNVIYDDKINFPAVLITFPDNFIYIVNDNVDIKHSETEELIRNIPVKNINEDNVNDILNNPFMKPDINVIYRSYQAVNNPEEVNYQNIHLIKLYLPKNYKFNRYNAVVIKQPRKIVVDILDPDNQVDCELNSYIHNDIVQKAVELALGAIGSAKFQIQGIETTKNVK